MWQHRLKRCWCGRKVDLGRSMQETGPVTPASRRRLAQVSRMISCVMSSGLTRLSQLAVSAIAVDLVPLSVSPSPLGGCCDGGLFLFLWSQKKRWVCCSKISDQRNGSGRNVIRLVVAKLFWDDGRQPCMLAVLCVTGVGFLRCLLAPESSLVNHISECESASDQESELISVCAESGLQLRRWGVVFRITVVRKTPQFRIIPQKQLWHSSFVQNASAIEH